MFHKIARVVKNISFILLSWQSSYLQKRLVKKLGYTKKTIVDGCSVDISQEIKDKREKITAEVKGIIKQLKNNPQRLCEYLENQGVEVHLIGRGERFFKRINESDGFITERKGYKALLINLAIGNGFKTKTEPMVIFSGDELDIYKLIRAIYTWYSYKEGMSGFDEKSQRLLQLLHRKNEDKIIARLSIPELEGLKNAVSRDIEAIDFVTQYSKENAGAKNALNKIKNDGGANI